MRKTLLAHMFEKDDGRYDLAFLYDADHPNAGGLNVQAWLEANDPTCDPTDGIGNSAKMASLTPYSEKTLVNSIMPDWCHYHTLGPIRITTVTSLMAGVAEYAVEMRNRMSAGGRLKTSREGFGFDASPPVLETSPLDCLPAATDVSSGTTVSGVPFETSSS